MGKENARAKPRPKTNPKVMVFARIYGTKVPRQLNPHHFVTNTMDQMVAIARTVLSNMLAM